MAEKQPTSNAPTLPFVGSAPTLPADSQPALVDVAPAPLDETPFAQRYRVRALLGAGGMGEVHLGKDERIGREVAIKVARDGSGSRPDAVARFLREARVQGQLEHPSIVPVYDLGRRSDGAVFFTMKRVRGLTLEQILDGQRRGDAEMTQRYSRRKLLTAFSNVCLAVDFAHSRGVLHRDLKPGNIMLGDFGEVYVLDWGLAKIAGVATEDEGVSIPGEGDVRRAEGVFVAAQEPQVEAQGAAPRAHGGATTSGAVMGTPGYMPPEQVRGQIEAVDPRVDVYPLGAVLFELLTSKPLHPRHSAAAALASTLEGADARASVRAPDRDVPPELEAICVRATAIDPAGRFASARELHDAIERYLDGDRDLARRRELANGHADNAAVAAGRALSDAGTEEDRRAALQQAGRALALDPSHAGAMQTMMRLLVAPPKQIPAEVKREVETSMWNTTRVAARAGAWTYLGWLLMTPIVFLLGMRDATSLAVFAAAIVAVSFVAFNAARQERPAQWHHFAGLILSSIAIVAVARLFGPYVMVPGLLIANTIGFLIHGPPSWRPATIAIGTVFAAAPIVLELFGIVAPTTTFDGDAIRITSTAVHLPPIPTTTILITSVVGVVIVSSLYVGRVRKALDRAEERLHLQSWHLRQLVPDEAHGALAQPSAPNPDCVFDRIVMRGRS